MHTLNITVGNTQGQTKPIHNLYKGSLDNDLDSNINNIMAKFIHIKPRLLRQGTSIMQSYMYIAKR